MAAVVGVRGALAAIALGAGMSSIGRGATESGTAGAEAASASRREDLPWDGGAAARFTAGGLETRLSKRPMPWLDCRGCGPPKNVILGKSFPGIAAPADIR